MGDPVGPIIDPILDGILDGDNGKRCPCPHVKCTYTAACCDSLNTPVGNECLQQCEIRECKEEHPDGHKGRECRSL